MLICAIAKASGKAAAQSWLKTEKHTAMHGLEQCIQQSHFAYTHNMLCLRISKSIVEETSLTLGRSACISFFSFDATLMGASSDP